MKDLRRVVHRNGVVEFDDPHTGHHMVVMEGITVETSERDALAIVSVGTVITCGSCFRRWIVPVADYRNGWSTCRHCKTRLFLPPIYLPSPEKLGTTLETPTVRGQKPKPTRERK